MQVDEESISVLSLKFFNINNFQTKMKIIIIIIYNIIYIIINHLLKSKDSIQKIILQ